MDKRWLNHYFFDCNNCIVFSLTSFFFIVVLTLYTLIYKTECQIIWVFFFFCNTTAHFFIFARVVSYNLKRKKLFTTDLS